jgi:hypothetical protein
MEEPTEIVTDRLLRDLLMAGRNNNSTSTVVFQGGGWSVGLLALAAVVAVGSLYVADDAKDEVKAVRLEQQVMRNELMAEIRDLRNTDNAIRAYINTGQMPKKKEK